jgi:integrase
MVELCCPECGSKLLYRDGFRYLADGSQTQRWLCRNCGYRFGEKSFKNCQTNNRSDAHQKAILMEVQRQIEKREAGATEQQDVKGKIVEFLWYLKKNGYNPSTINVYNTWLQTLMKRGANLFDGENVKEVIASTSQWCENTKTNVILAYKLFADYIGLKWNPPRHGYIQRKLPFIPLENEIDALIGGAGKKLATILQLLKETGMRIGEAAQLKWRDIDFERMTVSVNTPEKNSNARIFKVSPKLIAMLNMLPKKTDKVFNGEPRGWRILFLRTRKKLALKLQNPRLLQITFHTIRHWKATMEYHKTKNLLHVQQVLGHKNIQNTMIYTQLLDFEVEDEWHSATAKTVEEAKELIEAGFEYVCDIDGVKLFRKRK